MTEDPLDALRVAFIGVLGAERRLKGREGQRHGELSFSHYRMLSCLLGDGRMAAGRLAAAADLSPASTTQLLDLLEKREMVTRERDPGDRRMVVVVLTDEGRRMTEARREHFRAVWAEVLGDLDATQIAAGVTVLEHIAQVLEVLAERKAAAERT